MKILNLVYPEQSEIQYKVNKFPDGQQNIVIQSSVNYNIPIDNVVPCCTMCNFAKLHYSIDEFSEWLKRLINFQKENKTLKL